MSAEDKKRLVREFLEVLHSGDVDGALKRTTANPKLLIFNGEMPNGFQMLGGMIPALFASGPTREFTAQWVDGDTGVVGDHHPRRHQGGDTYENAYLIICSLRRRQDRRHAGIYGQRLREPEVRLRITGVIRPARRNVCLLAVISLTAFVCRGLG